MAAINVRGLSEDAKRALRVRAAQHGRSMEAEARLILEEAVLPTARLRLGTALVDVFRAAGLVDLSLERDRTPGRAADFE